MRFRCSHSLKGSPSAVADALGDPGFYTGLALPDLSAPEVVAHRLEDGRASVRLRYEYVGGLDALARRLLGSHRLTWVQEICVDQRASSGTLTFEADGDPRRLHGSASFELRPEGEGTVRQLEGELLVGIPGIGGLAERRIVPGMLRRLDIEAEALDRRLQGSG